MLNGVRSCWMRWMLVGVFGVLAVLVGAVHYVEIVRESNASEVIRAVERFRETTGRLPNSIEEAGIHGDEEGPVHYEREGDEEYTIWYGKAIGASRIYSSSTKSWSEGG